MAGRTYKSMGYSAEFFEDEAGAWLTISRNGKVVGEIAVAAFPEGPDAPVRISIKRFQPDELVKVTETNDY